VLTKRVEILFDPREYARLKEQAAKEKKSVATLIREAIRDKYLAPSLKAKRSAAEWIVSQEIDWGTWEEAKEEIIKGHIKE